MRWPWVSRWRLELAEERLLDREQRIEELLSVNAELLELNKQITAAPPVADPNEKPIEPQKAHRKLGADLRREFRERAETRWKEQQADKGSK
jgi:hypothetical protein